MVRRPRWGFCLVTLAGAAAACGPGHQDAPREVSVTVSPTQVALLPGTAQQFTASVSGADDVGVTWAVEEGAPGGSVDSNGRYAAPGVTGTYHVVVTSRADTSRNARATVNVANEPGPNIAIDPTSATLDPGGSQRFTATVTGTTDALVAWSLAEGAPGGAVDADGTYTAPAAPGTYHVVATSHAVPSLQAIAEVKVRSRGTVAVSIDPRSAEVPTGGSARFTATVAGTGDPRVAWSVREGTAGGTVDANGAYVAPPTPGTFHVVATAVVDAKASAAATVTVSAPRTTVAITPPSAIVAAGASQDFAAIVNGAQDDAAVIWSVSEGSTGGSVDAHGVYVAPATEGTFHVVATSHVAPDASATAAVTVTTQTTSRNLVDHGGPVLANARVYAVWWGERAAFGDAIDALESFFRGASTSSWLAQLDPYLRGVPAAVTFEGSLYDASPAQPKGPGDIDTELCAMLDAAGLAPDPAALYFVEFLVPRASNFWGPNGYHTTTSCHGVQIPTAVVVTDGTQLVGCNDGLSRIASWLVAVSSHELIEAMTDPLLSAWYYGGTGGVFDEIADRCGYGCPTIGNRVMPATTLWSNADQRCVWP